MDYKMKYVNETEETIFSPYKAPLHIIPNLITLIQTVNNLLNEMCYFGVIKKENSLYHLFLMGHHKP